MANLFALGKFTAAAIRTQARDRSELASQLLLGEPVEILDSGRAFCRIRCSDDDFEGYVRSDQLHRVDELAYRHQRDNPAFALDLFASLLGERHGLPISFGGRLGEYDGLRLRHADQHYTYSGQAALSADLRTDAELLLRFARRWLYVPQLVGGRTPSGVGAAALVQLVARLVNLRLPRTAGAMSHHGRPVDFVVQCQPADLAFFDGPRGQIDHVGLLLPESRILHVDGCVRVDAVDHYGIFNYELGRYTHRLRIVKRLFPDLDRPSVLRPERAPATEVDEQQLAIF